MDADVERAAMGIEGEFVNATALRDKRLRARLVTIGRRAADAPERSFPDMATTDAELTGLYRFFNNESVTADAIAEPHVRQTAQRCAETREVIVIHDTTQIEFSGEVMRRGLGPLRAKEQGLLLHAALAVANDGSARPLGVLGSHTWARKALGKSRNKRGRRKTGGDYVHEQDKESARWWSLIQTTETRLDGIRPIHVFDREGDAYALLRTLLDHDIRFVTRMGRDRVVLDDNDDRVGRVSEELIALPDVITLEVPISRRAATTIPNTPHTPRESRIARLAVGATKLLLAPPNYINGSPESLDVSVVYVREIDAPADVEPIAWVLMTTEPARTADEICAVVRLYRTRWLIEEYFKALKTGCAIERRQLESYESITAAIALFLPIAWQLLLLRNLARTTPNENAETVLTRQQIDVLRVAVPGARLSQNPTLQEAMRAIAYLGGHYIKREPGWMVLGRGMHKLFELEVGWQLALASRSDRT